MSNHYVLFGFIGLGTSLAATPSLAQGGASADGV